MLSFHISPQFNSYLFVFSSHISVHFCSISYHTPSSAYITSLPIIPSFLSFPLMFQQILECISFTSFYVYDVYFSILQIKYVWGYKYMIVCWRQTRTNRIAWLLQQPELRMRMTHSLKSMFAAAREWHSGVLQKANKQTNKQTNKNKQTKNFKK